MLKHFSFLCLLQEQLLPVPTALFQGSLLLGSVAQAVLGPAATGAAAFVHPALIAGWAGLVGSALNSLPVGSLDGGRMIQARARSRVRGGQSSMCIDFYKVPRHCALACTGCLWARTWDAGFPRYQSG